MDNRRIRNESAFSKRLCALLRTRGYFIQRIETGTTGKGIPDVYVIKNRGQSCWLELKRNPSTWRPGQKAWMLEATQRGIPCFTLWMFNNCIEVWDMSTVPETKCAIWNEWREVDV